MLPDALYLDCDLLSTRRRLEDPEIFLGSLPPASRVILDEILRLPDPCLPLKIAADHFSGLRLLATGSSTLAAGAKFRDTLAAACAIFPLSPFHGGSRREILRRPKV